MICGVWNVANEGQPFRTWGKIEKGSLDEAGYEPEHKANEGRRNKGVGHPEAVNLKEAEQAHLGMVVVSDGGTVRIFCAVK